MQRLYGQDGDDELQAVQKHRRHLTLKGLVGLLGAVFGEREILAGQVIQQLQDVQTRLVAKQHVFLVDAVTARLTEGKALVVNTEHLVGGLVEG
jgi:hypothetical protein